MSRVLEALTQEAEKQKQDPKIAVRGKSKFEPVEEVIIREGKRVLHGSAHTRRTKI